MNSKEYAQILYQILQGRSENAQGKIIANFQKFLLKNSQLHLINSILKEFRQISSDAEKENFTYISSASELAGSQKKALEKIFPKPLKFSVNKELLGGISVRRKDVLYNHTLRKKLEIFKSSL